MSLENDPLSKLIEVKLGSELDNATGQLAVSIFCTQPYANKVVAKEANSEGYRNALLIRSLLVFERLDVGIETVIAPATYRVMEAMESSGWEQQVGEGLLLPPPLERFSSLFPSDMKVIYGIDD